ncbi:hypothetical protein EDD15DRAFT_2529447 [Pisolithus albus]|nr:hypothetical protein EDD15DRAFT_2529447 [Pisolithus albus]
MEFLCKGRGLNEGRIKEFYTDLAVPSDFSHRAQGISRRFDRLALSKDSYLENQILFSETSPPQEGDTADRRTHIGRTICQVDTQHQEAAEIGIVETTIGIARYSDPNPGLTFAWYDIPGGGIQQQPDWMYFNPQVFFVFDCALVLLDILFTQTDTAILTNSVRESTIRRGHIKKNPKKSGLPDQRVYTVFNKTLLSMVKDRSPTLPHKIIDELELIKDVLGEAWCHRCGILTEEDDYLV